VGRAKQTKEEREQTRDRVPRGQGQLVGKEMAAPRECGGSRYGGSGPSKKITVLRTELKEGVGKAPWWTRRERSRLDWDAIETSSRRPYVNVAGEKWGGGS